MAKNLVIVESPAKAKTISRFLGSDYAVAASMGHIRDLPKSKLGVDVEHDFEPTYVIMKDKSKVIAELKKKISKETMIWIATDEDREGEAIGWHLTYALKIKKGAKRIVFHEITETAIKEALKNPRTLDMHLVDAQQARRVLDRLVGYELSPLLWKKIRYGLSAGRVQSVAVRLIVEREREIQAFVPKEYWSITVLLQKTGESPFEAELSRVGEAKAQVTNKDQADGILADLEGGRYSVTAVRKKEVKRNPSPPFTTSTLQQEASRKLGYSVKKTMMLAQRLYEGVDIEGAPTALITYMRTDSVHLADVALRQAKEVITKEFGAEYALGEPRHYKSRKGAQEAHEAIRPVDLSIIPDSVEPFLEKDQYRLYDLIWKRTLACQMQQAILDSVSVDVSVQGKNTPYLFRATGQTIKFAGFMRVYVESTDNPEEAMSDKEKILPELHEGDALTCEKVTPAQHFTKPPARYTEASLVKTLEAEGIGRPSTYAPTISTIIARGYIEKVEKQLKPTDTAFVVTDLLVEHFPKVVDYAFTARVEEELDEIAAGEREWVPMIREFYGPFHALITEKHDSIKKEDVVNEKSDEVCDKCGSPMVVKLSRYGKFLSCSKYPECKNAKSLPGAEGTPAEPETTDEKCPKCQKQMVVKRGRFGTFLGCSAYPECKGIKPIIKDTGVQCPKCGKNNFVEKRTRKGKIFYGCGGYPDCENALWSKPTGEKCPKCESLLVFAAGKKIRCSKKECDFEKEQEIKED